MRLLYLSGAPRVSTNIFADAGGPRSHVLGVIKGFELNGFKVDAAIAGDKINMRQISSNSATKVSKSVLIKLAADVMRIFYRYYFRTFFKKNYNTGYDFVYERLAAMQGLGIVFKKKNIPWILETNAPLFYEASKERNSTFLPRVIRYFELKAYRQCTYLVCVSNKLKEILLNEYNLPEEKIFVMPNAVDIDKFSSSNTIPKLKFNELTIGFVGTVQPWQKLDLLLHACYDLKKFGNIIKIVIVGDGLDLERLKQLTKKLQIEDLIVYTGRVKGDDVPAYIKSFDVGYSGPETMQVGLYVSPLKLYEYMAAGIPALASSSEDAETIIEDEINGFLFNNNDVESLKNSIANIIIRRHELKSIGEQARTSIIASHNWKRRVEDLLKFIKQSQQMQANHKLEVPLN